jgi:hypothetical protein
MKIDLENLITTLSALSQEEMDGILDVRDAAPFDSSWCALNEIVGEIDRYPEAKDTFIQISTATHQHEITSYIADDIDLIFRAENKGIDTPFLRYLADCYSKGIIPREWKGI